MPLYLPPISRRKFLATSTALGAAALVPRELWAAARAVDADRWVLLSDTHVWDRRHGAYRGVRPEEGLAQALREILALDPRPAGMLICGDCANMETGASDYAVLAELLQLVRAAGIPIHLLLGNHDHRPTFWKTFPEAQPSPPLVANKHVAIVETPRVNWLLLDSLEKTHSRPGLLGKEQLQWLAKVLDDRAGKPALVAAHHFLGFIGGLADSAAFWELISARKQVKAYWFGHSHLWRVSAIRAVHLVNVPTTAWPFSKQEPRGWVDVALHDNGAAVELHALDRKHPKHGERVQLMWR